MAIQVNFPFDTPGNYTPSNAVVAGGEVQIVNDRPADATFGATYTTDVDGSFGDGVLTGTAVGGAAVSGAKLDLRNFGKYVDYAGAGNADSAQQGAVKFKFTPDYSTKPVGGWNIFFTICNAPGSLNNRIEFRHSSSAGQLQFRLNDSTGASLGTVTLANWNPTAGQEYEFEFNWDFDSGNHRIFIDGILFATFNVTGTRTTAAGLLRVGADYNAADQSDGEYADFVVFDAVQHTANYTPGYTLPEADYSEGTITPTAKLQAQGLVEFIATEDDVDGTIRYAIEVDSQLRWWNGAAWANSDGSFAQLSSAADINANAATLLSAISLIRFFARLQSTDGTGTPALEHVLMCYDYGPQPPANSPLCEVYGFIRDMGGNPVVGATITATTLESGKYVETDSVVVSGSQSAVTDSDGRFDLKLIQGLDVCITIQTPEELVDTTGCAKLQLTVPALDFVDITTLLP